jgi:hypothetical protein
MFERLALTAVDVLARPELALHRSEALRQRHAMPAPAFEPCNEMPARRLPGGQLQEQLRLSDGLPLHQGKLH